MDNVLVLTINHAILRLEVVVDITPSASYEESRCLGSGVREVWLQGWNLKELTEGHNQKWSLRLNLTQRGETYQAQT